jgi:hypothetical protein
VARWRATSATDGGTTDGRICASRSSGRSWRPRPGRASCRRRSRPWRRGSGSIRSATSRCASRSRRWSAGTIPLDTRRRTPSARCAAACGAMPGSSRRSASGCATPCAHSTTPTAVGVISSTSTICVSWSRRTARWARCPRTRRCAATCRRRGSCANGGAPRAIAPSLIAWRWRGSRAKCGATRSSTSADSGTRTSTTAASKSSPRRARGSRRCSWPFSMITRASVVTRSGISPKRPRRSCTGCVRRSRNAG